MKIPVFNCMIDETDNDTGIYAMSFVECPANEVDFITLRKDKREICLNKDSKKQILTGVVLKPDQLIYRNSEKHGEHYIRFTASEIEKIAQKMMKTGLALSGTTHEHQTPLNGNYLTELWIVENPANDKSKALGFDNLPKGTLMCSYKIEDKTYWEREVMSGNVKGFSLEGLFNQEIALSQNKTNLNRKRVNMKKKNLLSKIGRFLLEIDKVVADDATASGTAYVLFDLADGKQLYVDKDGFATLDGEQMPAGEHLLADGNTLTVDENGQFIETQPSSEKTGKPKEAVPPQTLAKSRKLRFTSEEEKPVTDEEPQEDEPGSDTVDTLKAKIAELESKLAELATTAAEANAEVEKLKTHTPSARPIVQKSARPSEGTYATRMADALSLTMQHLRKK